MALDRPTYAMILLACLAAGCSRGGDLEPAASANRVVGMDDAAVAIESGVQLIVQGDEWPEEQIVPERVTPVLVDIVHRGDEPLRIEYRHFSLTTNDARTLAVLPPFRVYGTPTQPLVQGDRQQVELSYDASGFQVAPVYSGIYEELPVYSKPFVVDQRYHGTTYAGWQRTGAELPTRTMKVMALPEGVLSPGGHVTGYLYFEKVPAGTRNVAFHMNLVDGDTGRIFAIASVPFTVDR